MTYDVQSDRVLWRTKPIKGAEPANFTILHPIIARTPHTVFVLGKPFAADPASFEVLNDGYARDATRVFRIMDTKIKPLPKADVPTFTALGPNHGRDAVQAFYDDKRMVVPKSGNATAMRPLSDHFATDGTRLYFGAKTLKVRNDDQIDWTTAQMRLLAPENPVNPPHHAIGANGRVWYFNPLTDHDYVDLGAADIAALRVLKSIRAPSGNYITNGASVWYKGTRLPCPDAQDARAVSTHLAEAGGVTWHGATATDHPGGTFNEGPNRMITGLLCVVSDHGIWDVPIPKDDAALRLCAARADQPQLGAQDLNTLVTRLIDTAREVFLDENLHDHFPSLTAIEELRKTTPAPITATLGPDGITATLADGTTFAAPAQTWWTLAMRIHLHLTDGAGVFLNRPKGNWLPRGTAAQDNVLQLLWPDMCRLTTALWNLGAQDDARVLALTLFQAAHSSRLVSAQQDAVLAALSALPLDLIDQSHWSGRTHEITNTTNLGVLKLMLTPEWIAHDDWRCRLDAVLRLHGVIHDTPKLAQAGDEAFDILTSRRAVETVPFIRQQIDITLQMIADSADRVPKRGTMNETRRTVLRWLIDHGINVAQNTDTLATM